MMVPLIESRKIELILTKTCDHGFIFCYNITSDFNNYEICKCLSSFSI